ncbi:MAG: GNAT family N-acetyltransferase [Chloroflexi bacterium]|nr:GNAT family N-acetyltransferase [Chloroflexota bacterium]
MQSSEVHIRPATERDLPRVGAIWYQAVAGVAAGAPPWVPSLYPHELASQELYVAERGGEVAAFGAVVHRGRVAFLADLFVAAEHRSTGVGKQLLGHILPPAGHTCCTVSSDDPRALPLYARAGMRPWYPQLQLRADLARVRLEPGPSVELIELEDVDGEYLRWDAEIGGRARPEDHRYWRRARGGRPCWFVRDDRVVGYGLAQTRSDDLVASPDAVTLGPIGVRDPADAVACVLAAVGWARGYGRGARISLTGPHPALAPLLDAGFQLVEREIFCLSAEAPFFDARCYLPSGSDLF